jgi:hypothetical protein
MLRKVITNPSDAGFLKSAPIFVVDIETNTEAPNDEWPKDSFGTSYVTDITTVAFYAPGHDPVVLDVRGYPDEMVEFVRSVFVRPNYKVIGHYVVFDLRMLGGHFNFLLPRGVRVYDTKVMSALLMLGEPESRHGLGSLSLAYQTEQFDLFEDEDDRAFYGQMKGWRGELHNLAEVLRQTGPDSVLWRYTRGYPRYEDLSLPSAQVDEHLKTLTGQEITDLTEIDLDGHAQDILVQYAAMDVINPYKLYEIHQDFARKLTVQGVKLTNDIVVPKWDTVVGLMDWEERISWLSSNQAITGIDIDADYIQKKRMEWAEGIQEEIQTILALPDPTDPYASWIYEFKLMLWYSRTLAALSGAGTYSDVTRWVNWGPPQTSIGEDSLSAALSFIGSAEPEADEFRRGVWVTWLLHTLTPEMKRAQALRTLPGGDIEIPSINLREWVRQTCFANHPPVIGEYLAKLKTDWLSRYYTLTTEMTANEIVNSDMWKPYHLFVVCGIELPTREEIQEEGDLTTDKFRRALGELEELAEKEGYAVNELELALRTDTLSLGKKALAYYLKRFVHDQGYSDEDELTSENAPVFMHFARLMQLEADFATATEILLHASRDGKVHSTIDRGGTRTTRYSSTSPNMQNKNAKRFRGFFRAPDGFCLVELDFSNAENVMGAMIAGDDAFAYATESGDFHSAMAKTYWPDAWAEAEEAGNKARLKELRQASKPITFAIPYGAGPAKIARVMKRGLDEAKRIIDLRRTAFARVEAKKKEVGDNCMARWNKGLRPAYVPLWTGRRVIVPTFFNEKAKPSVYKTWNYLQQGGVAEMTARAQVEATEMLLDGGYKSFIVMNIHDSVILAVRIEEWPDVVQKVIQIMCHQVPKELTHRTIPAVHFVTEVGPENAQKWGWRHEMEYPFPLDEFVNQWGCHKLDEKDLAKDPKEREAPTWRGPVHEGWTLENEMNEQKAQRARLLIADETMTGAVEAEPVGKEWAELSNIMEKFDDTLKAMAYIGVDLKTHRQPAHIKYRTDDDLKIVGPLTFTERMVASQVLTHKGHQMESYISTLATVKKLTAFSKTLTDLSNDLTAWEERYGKHLPDA